MNYLERNALLLEEISKAMELKRGKFIAVSSKTNVYTGGNFFSNLLDRNVALALKIPYDKFHSMTDKKFISDLSLIGTISQQIPEISSWLPECFGLLVGPDGTNLGIVTEDFSDGKKHKVREMSAYSGALDDPLLIKLRSILSFGDHELHLDDLASMCFRVGSQIRLGDFDNVLIHWPLDERFDFFNMQYTTNHLDQFKVVVNNPLFNIP